MEDVLPLAGVRVVEWAEGIPGPTAGWLCAECGAEVVKIESSRGDRLRGRAGFHVLNRGKRSLVLDPERPADRERFARLAADADVVIVDEAERRLEETGAAYDPARTPALVWCSLPLFGREGPRAGLPPEDALVAAAGGLSAMQWSYGKTPVSFVTPMASYATGFLAALGIAAALRARGVTGRGQRVDTSGLAAAMLLQSGTYVTGAGHEGSLAMQADDPRGVFPTYGLYRTADGWIFVGALTEAFWAKLATLLERTDLLADPELPTNPMAFGKPEIRDRLRRELEPIFASRPTEEWLRRLEEADVPIGKVQSRFEYLHEPLAEATGAVIELDDPEVGTLRQAGPPVSFDGRIPPLPRPAPKLAAEPDVGFRSPRRSVPARSGTLDSPLRGVRVLDLASFIAGPLCPMLLADLGADVVKIESPQGDPFRLATFGFEGWNRGKRSIVLDLKKRQGRDAFLRLADTADAVVENFRGGVMDDLGLGRVTLAERNPRLVYTAITGFGSAGPAARKPGFDPVMQARSGFCRAQGGDGEPVLHQVAYTDYMSGTLAAFATVVALFDRERAGGRGRHVGVSLHRTAFAMQAAEVVEHCGAVPEAKGGRDLIGWSAAYRAYRTRDGWIYVAARSVEEAAAFGRCAGIARDAERLIREPAGGDAAADVAARLAGWEKEALAEALRRAGVPAVPCLELADIFDDAHLRETRLIVETDHPRLGRLRQTGEWLRFSATPMIVGRPAPALGEHGREILAGVGMSAPEVDAIVATAPTR